jgi:phosphoribosylformylglycinamidine cyclo-ligase
VLVSGTDGVGTKLKLAFAINRHDTIGIDLVAMSVNDIITSGAEPLFFLDYFASSGLNVDQAAQVISGIARGCEESGCTLLGGETAELPGFYQKGEYDLAGFAVGVVEKSKIIDGSKVQVGDAIVGIASSGLHSNGYSLARKVLIEQNNLSMVLKPEGFHRPLGEELLEPTKIYARAVMDLCSAVEVRGLAHITGSGLPGNVPRCLPDGTKAVLEERSWKRPPIFDFIAKMGDVARDEMFSTFNMGLGMVVVVPQAHAPAAIRECKKAGVQAWEVGRVEKGAGEATAQIV